MMSKAQDLCLARRTYLLETKLCNSLKLSPEGQSSPYVPTHI